MGREWVSDFDIAVFDLGAGVRHRYVGALLLGEVTKIAGTLDPRGDITRRAKRAVFTSIATELHEPANPLNRAAELVATFSRKSKLATNRSSLRLVTEFASLSRTRQRLTADEIMRLLPRGEDAPNRTERQLDRVAACLRELTGDPRWNRRLAEDRELLEIAGRRGAPYADEHARALKKKAIATGRYPEGNPRNVSKEEADAVWLSFVERSGG